MNGSQCKVSTGTHKPDCVCVLLQIIEITQPSDQMLKQKKKQQHCVVNPQG